MGEDGIMESEAKMIFKFMDQQGVGWIGIEEFKNLMQHSRNVKNGPEKYATY